MIVRLCINLHVHTIYGDENQSIESKVVTIHADYMNVNKMSSLDRVQMGQERMSHIIHEFTCKRSRG